MKRKPPQQQLSFAAAFEHAAFVEQTSHLPDSIELAGPLFMRLLRDLDAAILASDLERAETVRLECHQLAERLNGGSNFGMKDGDDSSCSLLECASHAIPGTVPLWGQQGNFVMEVGGLQARIEVDGVFGVTFGGFAVHAIDRANPFVSETGYRSFMSSGGVEAGVPVDLFVRRVIENHIAGELKGQLRWIRIEYGGPGEPPAAKKMKKKRG